MMMDAYFQIAMESMENCFERLPVEIVEFIFSFASVQDLAQLSLLCKLVHRVTNSEYFRNKMIFYFKIVQKYQQFLKASQICFREIVRTEGLFS